MHSAADPAPHHMHPRPDTPPSYPRGKAPVPLYTDGNMPGVIAVAPKPAVVMMAMIVPKKQRRRRRANKPKPLPAEASSGPSHPKAQRSYSFR